MEEETTKLQRKMEARHLLMISLGGVIGTGLFLSSGYTIHEAGPVGTILAYLVGAVIVYLVMLCLGELSVAMPQTGSFHVYADKFIGPGTGFTVAILYWLTWTVALGSEFTAAGLIMHDWFKDSPTWLWSVLFMLIIFMSNALSVRFFAETEFFFSSIKVVAIILFILLGTLAIFGIIPLKGYSSAPLFHNLFKDGWFPTGFKGVFTTMLTVNYAFSGTELIGVTAGETKDPAKNIPKAIHTTLIRLCLFFIGSIIVMSALIPWKEAGVTESPFVLVLNSLGFPFAGAIMNFVVLTAILSAANSGLYASTRMLWSLANEHMIPQKYARTNKRGIPMIALTLSMLGGLLALLSSVIAASTVYLVLVSVAGLAVVFVWMAIAYAEIQFRKNWLASGHTVTELKFKTPWYPVVPWLAFSLSLLSCVLIVFDPTQRPALFYMIPFVILCYVVYYTKEKIKLNLQKKESAQTGIEETSRNDSK
ncbi:amino acid permease [Liquorilactobacillus satsumensis]|uniref:APC family amino acid-polyamine-organocation transporter n=1 Tax=Liquorilactobacillus satsumensis DSM 16230 = JCM 12392 TaxID=1423801 RepID=A0A0R1UWY7_9LACO|nr:amino acid permease [Liquorilactobacillus satsumensis]KRL97775.1 APC family amino acid-polyamine-organocation transporter [Liquorilactobacillus satsumensis DSM 16230 = JCM 12392]MCP9313382.1 amino acid permease [Liquorilactobacillus satsumensis]MCP9329155.1 amino acid permease [Liquorilactobacillus satsumensis]MCP9360078.1 amino acid permease [Liquorilactobacillus satsumensis]